MVKSSYKSFYIASLLVGSALALSACMGGADTDEKAADKAAWSYADSDPDMSMSAEWAALSADNMLCKMGRQQSPVDLPTMADANKAVVVVPSTVYMTTNAEVVNKGHAIQANFSEGMELTSGDNTYGLLQVHFHTPSEHTVAGEASPMDAHFVHADSEGNLAVLGIFINEGEANPQLQAILDNIGGEVELDVAAMLPSDLTAYNYPGSLTTPPCSEGVNWHVVAQPVTASAEQLAAFRDMMGMSARPVQPMHEREM